jgi:hypothetical protein
VRVGAFYAMLPEILLMTKLIVILIIGLTFEAIGVVFLSRGLKQVGEVQQISVSEILRVAGAGVTNPNVLFGVFFEALFFGCLLVLMSKKADISFIWPLTALGFVFTTLAARFVLHEHISAARWGGVVLIMMGAGLITYSEKSAESQTKTTPTAVSNAPNVQ